MLKLSGEVSDVDCEKFSKSGSGEFANVLVLIFYLACYPIGISKQAVAFRNDISVFQRAVIGDFTPS